MFFALLVVGSVVANGIDVPKKIATTFKAKYPTVEEVNWTMSDNIYTAEFMIDENDAISNFEKDGKWIETIIAISEEDLPDAVIAYLEENYGDSEIDFASKIEQPSGTIFSIEKEITKEEDEEVTEVVTLNFDEDGNLIDG